VDAVLQEADVEQRLSTGCSGGNSVETFAVEVLRVSSSDALRMTPFFTFELGETMDGERRGRTQRLDGQSVEPDECAEPAVAGAAAIGGNLLTPQFQSILNNPGFSAADKAAITGQSQGALASAFDSCSNQRQTARRARGIRRASAS